MCSNLFKFTLFPENMCPKSVETDKKNAITNSVGGMYDTD